MKFDRLFSHSKMIVCSIILSIILIFIFYPDKWTRTPTYASPLHYCQMNQMKIDGAIQQFMIENNYDSLEDALAHGLVFESFVGEDNYLIKMPKCPERGKYSILTRKGSLGETVECSFEGHDYPSGS